jgi:hypothetical protein
MPAEEVQDYPSKGNQQPAQPVQPEPAQLAAPDPVAQTEQLEAVLDVVRESSTREELKAVVALTASLDNNEMAIARRAYAAKLQYFRNIDNPLDTLKEIVQTNRQFPGGGSLV